jgi:hypothetical protein
LYGAGQSHAQAGDDRGHGLPVGWALVRAAGFRAIPVFNPPPVFQPARGPLHRAPAHFPQV